MSASLFVLNFKHITTGSTDINYLKLYHVSPVSCRVSKRCIHAMARRCKIFEIELISCICHKVTAFLVLLVLCSFYHMFLRRNFQSEFFECAKEFAFRKSGHPSLMPTAKAKDPPSVNSPTMHIRISAASAVI